jgi:hypothetical protein
MGDEARGDLFKKPSGSEFRNARKKEMKVKVPY